MSTVFAAALLAKLDVPTVAVPTLPKINLAFPVAHLAPLFVPLPTVCWAAGTSIVRRNPAEVGGQDIDNHGRC